MSQKHGASRSERLYNSCGFSSTARRQADAQNIQRQEGLELTDDLTKIKANDGKYVVVQELLLDSYLVNNRKINERKNNGCFLCE